MTVGYVSVPACLRTHLHNCLKFETPGVTGRKKFDAYNSCENHDHFAFVSQVIEMRVRMDCAGCESKIKKALQKLQGVDVIDIDMAAQKVTVMGWADQEKVLKAVRKTGRRAELWPYPYDDMQQYYYYYQRQPYEVEPPIPCYATQCFTTTTTSSYNSQKNSYSDVDYGYYHIPPRYTLDDAGASSMFSDENPHACSVM